MIDDRKTTRFERIPPEEFGPGCRLDVANNRVIGASGAVYENVRVNAEELMKLFPPPTTH